MHHDGDQPSPRQPVSRDSSPRFTRCRISHSLLSHIQCEVHTCRGVEVTAKGPSELKGMVQRQFLPLRMQDQGPPDVK